MKQYTRVMFAVSAHEFRTPISAALNGLSLIKPGIKPKFRQSYDIAWSSLEFLLMLVNDTLDFAAMESGNLKMTIESMSLREKISEVTAMIAVQMKLKKEVKLECFVSSDVPEQIEMDQQRLKQILMNLIKNATKFTKQGVI
jgi:signal transduction histidine kinase